MLTIGSLFSGIGGFELGLEWAGLGPVLWQVEIDPKCRNCLATHWPEAERYEDVHTVGKHNLKSVDLICGGFPCQDVSSAGKRVGLSGARSGLWYEFQRVVEELRPSWVVVENVSSGGRKWVDAVRFELERLGYGSLPIPLEAADCGAWHIRGRIFLVAYIDGIGSKQPDNETDSGGFIWKTWGSPLGRSSLPSDTDPLELREQSGRWLGKNRPGRTGPVEHCGWETEPNVARVVHGFPGRVDRERALGNSVVPQCAEVVGWVIRELMAD